MWLIFVRCLGLRALPMRSERDNFLMDNTATDTSWVRVLRQRRREHDADGQDDGVD